MFEDYTVRIRHILDAAREAITFAKDQTCADRDTGRKLNLSLFWLLEIIGEAAGRISQECKVKDSGLTQYYYCSALALFSEMNSWAPIS
jgi:uncharacterized protein with HEPN domain